MKKILMKWLGLDALTAEVETLKANKDWIEGEIEDKVQEAIDNAGIEEQVRDLFNDASPSPMSEEDIKAEIAEQVKAHFRQPKIKPKKK